MSKVVYNNDACPIVSIAKKATISIDTLSHSLLLPATIAWGSHVKNMDMHLAIMFLC